MLAAPSNFSYAQSYEYIFKQLKLEDGLSQTTIVDILQDQKGYIWFATSNGLNRYDGYKFKVFTNDPFDSLSLSDNGISALFEDSRGNLWVGTNSGYLNKYDSKTESFERIFISDSTKPAVIFKDQVFKFPITISRNNNFTVTSITEDISGNLWIGTFGEGLKYFDRSSDKLHHIHYDPNDPSSLSYDRVMKVFIDSESIIWIATLGGGLNRLKKFELFEDIIKIDFFHYYHEKGRSSSLSSNNAIEIFEDSRGSIWIGTFDGGLNRLSVNQKLNHPDSAVFQIFRSESNKNSLCNNTVMALEEDENGNIWIATFGGGIDEYDIFNNSFNHFVAEPLNENSLADNDVISLKFDNSGILWIGTHLGEGISKLEKRRKKFGHIKSSAVNRNSLSDDVVWAVLEDKNDQLWVGTYRGGLNLIDRARNKFTVFDVKDYPQLDRHIRSLVQDKNGNIWIGTYSNGLVKRNSMNGKFEKVNLFEKLGFKSNTNQIQRIMIDSKDNFWIGTFGDGLIKFEYDFENDRIKKIDYYQNDPSKKKSISDNRIYSLFEGKDGTIWVGTFGGGLCRLKEDGVFDVYKKDDNDRNSLSDNRVMTIYEDYENNLWLGTYGGALNKFLKEKEIFLKYTEKSGLGSDVVYGILEDDKFNLWMSTDNGIFKFNYKEEIFAEYDLQDGIQSLEFSGGAYFKSNSGEMFFGGINGLNYFYPDSVESNFFIPPVVITGFSIFDKSMPGDLSEIELNYDQNFFSFEFSALDFTNPEDNNYAYILEGLENTWRFVDANRRIATYTNLAPGKYTFRVIGSNSDGIWNTEGTSIRLTILPPFWRTWWFILAAMFLIIGIIYYIGTLRFRNLLAIEKLKSKLAADLHDNIGSGLTEISILSELAVREKSSSDKKDQQNFNKVSEKARELVDGMSEIVWMINPKHDTLHELFVRLKNSYSELCTNLGISFKINNLNKLKNVRLTMEHKQNIFLIFKEAINNSLKHGDSSKINLDAELKGEIIKLTLTDDGTGFDQWEESFGNGIKNMKQRAKNINGRILIDSQKGKGTKITYIGKIKGINRILNFFNR